MVVGEMELRPSSKEPHTIGQKAWPTDKITSPPTGRLKYTDKDFRANYLVNEVFCGVIMIDDAVSLKSNLFSTTHMKKGFLGSSPYCITHWTVISLSNHTGQLSDSQANLCSILTLDMPFTNVLPFWQYILLNVYILKLKKNYTENVKV